MHLRCGGDTERHPVIGLPPAPRTPVPCAQAAVRSRALTTEERVDDDQSHEVSGSRTGCRGRCVQGCEAAEQEASQEGRQEAEIARGRREGRVESKQEESGAQSPEGGEERDIGDRPSGEGRRQGGGQARRRCEGEAEGSRAFREEEGVVEEEGCGEEVLGEEVCGEEAVGAEVGGAREAGGTEGVGRTPDSGGTHAVGSAPDSRGAHGIGSTQFIRSQYGHGTQDRGGTDGGRRTDRGREAGRRCGEVTRFAAGAGPLTYEGSCTPRGRGCLGAAGGATGRPKSPGASQAADAVIPAPAAAAPAARARAARKPRAGAAPSELGTLTVAQLRDRARSAGRPGYSRLSKAQLIELLSS